MHQRRVDCTEFREHFIDDQPVLFPAAMTGVDHVQQQIGFTHLVECRAKAGDEMMRQLTDESDSVGEQTVIAFAEIDIARERIERRKQSVFNVHILRAAQRAQHGALACVRVSDQ